MSTIGKIRKRSGLLIVVVGIAMAAFILSDLFSASGGQQTLVIGEIAGDEIDLQEFDSRVQYEIDAVKQANPNLSEAQSNQIRSQVWNQMVRERIFDPQLNAIGLKVTQEEYNDVRFGENIMDDFKNDQTFVNPETGQFSPETVQQYFAYLQENFPALWQSQKNSIVASRLGTKYNNLIKKGLMVNSVEAQDAALANSRKVNIEFVQKKFASIADSLVSVSEKDVKAFYDAHKSEPKYKQSVNRSADFVSFRVEASDEDKKAIRKELLRLKKEFENADNDSLFVTLNNDEPFTRPLPYEKGTFEEADSLIASAEPGTVVGPFVSGKNMMLVKVLFNGSDKEVNARHILLRTDENNTVAQLKVKADSLMKVAKRKNNFEALAKEFSQDGSAGNGGSLDWFGRGQMVTPFENAAFNTKVGQMTIVESRFGVHLIKVEDNRPVDAIRTANITRELLPSNETIDAIYNEASQLSIENGKISNFLAIEGYELLSANNVVPNATFVPGISGDPKEFVRWMYKAEKGDVSEPLELENQIVVVGLTQINEEGEPTFEAVRDRMEREVIKAKKAELIASKMTGATLEEMAKNAESKVETANDISFSSAVITGVGREPKLVGSALMSEPNKISAPVVGENGVYVFKVNAVTEGNTNAMASTKQQLQSTIRTRVDNSAYGALVEKAEVKDFRYKYY